MIVTPNENPSAQALIARLILLETERDAAVGYLLHCMDRQGQPVDWLQKIQNVCHEGDEVRENVAEKYGPLKEYSQTSAFDYQEYLSLLLSVPVSPVTDKALWKTK